MRRLILVLLMLPCVLATTTGTFHVADHPPQIEDMTARSGIVFISASDPNGDILDVSIAFDGGESTSMRRLQGGRFAAPQKGDIAVVTVADSSTMIQQSARFEREQIAEALLRVPGVWRGAAWIAG